MQGLSIEGFRLSPLQQRLWLLQQSTSMQSYRVCCAVLIEGNLNTKILEFALQNVVDRYEILRTNFRSLEGMTIPLQVVTDYKPIVFYYNFSSLDTEQQQAKLDALFQEASQVSFDFEDGSVLTCSLVILSEDLHVLLVCLPATNADRITLNNFVREISRCYAAYSHDKEISDEPLQYVDIAEWQNEILEGDDGIVGREYWRKKNIPALVNLPVRNPNQAGFEPKFITLTFDRDRLTNLEAIAQKYNTSLSTLLLACWQVLFSRLTGQSDVVIGTCFHGRNYEGLEDAFGLFAKYLPISSHLEEDLQFCQVLNLVNESIQDVSKWQESFKWEDESSFFPVCFDFAEHPGKYHTADISFSLLKEYICIDKFQVKLSCWRWDDSLIAEFHYDANLLQIEEISRLAGQFQTLLDSVIEKPEAVISQLEFLTHSDRHQLLIEFNQTQVSYPQPKFIHHLFEQQIAHTPDNIAVVFENQQLTYQELNKQANRLAHYLQKLGVRPEVLVGVYVERSLDMIVALLGILKAGGAYLPLDPAIPAEGLALRLQDSQAAVLLTQARFVESLSEHKAQVVCFDTDGDAIAQQPEENPTSLVTPENLIYVLYTSGSTGKPKGVAVEHRQLFNYLYGILEQLKLPTGASFATVSTFAADLGNTVIFPSLCTGGCLHIISQECATNPTALADYCHHHPIDCLKIVPSHLAALLTGSHPEQILPRQCLVLGGEVATWELIEQIRQHANCRIINHYGPTETTIGVLTYPVEDYNPKSATVPLGRPLPNTQIYLLNQHLQPVPLGVPGELYIGGDNLARGYLNQPELTEEKFIPNPFNKSKVKSQKSKANRLYKTGDLARYLPDGTIEFLGRIDHQVKIRGFRIELGEIEAVLSEYPSVQQVVVIARDDMPGGKRLVAYIIPKQGVTASIRELRNFLKEKLPEYMLPSAFVLLDTLPLTPNGKVNRQALPAPREARLEYQAFVAPRDALELQIARIWEDIFDTRPLGVTDNFFDLGGHSLLAVRLMTRMQQQFNQELQLSTLFQGATIEHLASILRQQNRPCSQSPLVAIQTDGSKQTFFCVHPAGGNVLCFMNLARHLGSEQPFYGLQAPGLYAEQKPYYRVEDMATYYIQALRTVQPQGPYFLGGLSMGGVVAFEMAQQLVAQGQKVNLLALMDVTAMASSVEPTEEDYLALLGSFAQDLGLDVEDLDFSLDYFLQLTFDEQLAYILEQLRMENLLAPDVELPQIRRLFHVFKTNTYAKRSYVPRTYPGRVTLFKASDRSLKDVENPTLGWDKVAASGVDIHQVPGNHYTLIRNPHVQVLAEQLRVCLDEAQADYS